MTTVTDPRVLELRAKRTWGTVVVGLLSLQIAVGATAIYLANSDDTVAVIPNYYESAVNWDVTRKARQRLEKLGWEVDHTVGPAVSGSRTVVVEVKGKSGAPIRGVNMSAAVFHYGQGSTIHRFKLSEAEPGRYVGATDLLQAGNWELKLRMEGDQGLAELVTDVAAE